MKKLPTYLLCFLLCFLLCLPSVLAVPAEAKPPGSKLVRVGWYDSAFHHKDQFGRRSGYGYEYQQRIAAFTGWTYEYVEGSWSELFEKLVTGEIDLLSDVSYTEERAGKILYSAEVMGSEDYHVFIAPDNDKISPEDFQTFNGKRVGVNKNSIQEQLFVEWTKQHGVSPEIVEFTEKTPELLAMLDRGEIDALVTLDTYGRQADVLPVCKVGSASSYFGISRLRPDLKQELDVAMNRILEDNRDYNEQLTGKFNKASSISNFLNHEEQDWLDGHGAIRVGYQTDYLPFCGTDPDTQSLTGTLSDCLEFAETCEKNAELHFETRGFGSTQEGLDAMARGEIDCFFPIGISTYDGEQLGVIITDPFMRSEPYAVLKTTKRQSLSPEESLVVAVKAGDLNYESFLMDNFPDWKPVPYEDLAAGMNAVVIGEADCALVSNYRLNRITRQCSRYRLASLATGASMDLSFAVRQEDSSLYSILNKISSLLTDTMVSSSLSNYSLVEERVTFGVYLRDNLATVVAVLAVLASVILLLLLKSVRAEMKASEGRRLISEAELDSLTNLYSQNFFFAYANRISRDHPDRAMDAVVLNIERFHAVNNLNGHEFGDEVLRTIGTEIKVFLKGTYGIAGRLNGDRFDIFCAHREDYRPLLDHLQACMDQLSRNMPVRLRMGVMPWQKGMPPEQMFDLARSACSMVRGNFKNPLMVYDEELRRRDQLSLRLQSDLQAAITGRQLEIYYQPKYDIRPGKAVLNSAEALVRWNHPELGMIRPSDFIPMFERSGQITDLDKFVWAEAARQVGEWRDRFGVTLPVSVNLSRVDVFDPALIDVLDGIVEDNGLDRRLLNLEVTESAYTESAEELIDIIRKLREKGYEIEMDDFGSGYSSLNMLSSMPIDVLKMDMAFVRNIERNERDLRFVELILDIARYLKVPVIAEGVETGHQLALLKDAGCALVQGYYFSKPLPPDEFAARLLEGKAL